MRQSLRNRKSTVYLNYRRTSVQWGLKLSKMEGIIPAIETAHAFAVLDEMKFKPEDIVVINLSGRGDKDLNTYIEYFKL
jgi:tryptophan synthase beta chain